jgi:hypothetical protein
MQLESFRVTNFRSIHNSSDVSVARITAMLGRNESGKSNLLRGLHSLNPAEGFKALNPIKDFPRHRRLEECTDNTPVVTSRWILDEQDRKALAAVLPSAESVTHVQVGRRYGKSRWVVLEGLAANVLDETDIKSKVRRVVAAVKAAADAVEEAKKAPLGQAADTFDAAMVMQADRTKWAQAAVKGVLRKNLRGPVKRVVMV